MVVIFFQLVKLGDVLSFPNEGPLVLSLIYSYRPAANK